ncbi:hypothetical protein B8T70_06320 [Flavobacterium sp. AJR]|nr:hypothetical protein B8T70_06320 [Flavobacterium sp. AJR]
MIVVFKCSCFSPECNENTLRGNCCFFLKEQSDQRKLLLLFRKKQFTEKYCNAKREKADQK